MRIVHISDSHISVEHPQRTADLRACIDVINVAAKPPDAVMHTGDITHNGVAEEYNIAKQQLDELKVPYFVMPGNKDKRPALIDAFADGHSIRQGDDFIQYSIDHYPVRLVVLDTLSDNSNKGLLGDVRFKHIKEMLEAEPLKPTAVFMHHTPFEVAAIPDPRQFEDWQEVAKLRALFSAHRQISGVYCGHIHRSIDGRLGDLSVSAISCMATDLRKGELTAEQRHMPILRTHVL
ncbi:MAG: metallophosphoesterase [Granulosicoccaceae bacterium]